MRTQSFGDTLLTRGQWNETINFLKTVLIYIFSQPLCAAKQVLSSLETVSRQPVYHVMRFA